MSKDKALKLALEALERVDAIERGMLTTSRHHYQAKEDTTKAITALREALAEQPAQHRSTGWVSHRDQYAVPVLFNPYTGEPRDVRDVQSDPQGILIVPPGKAEMLAATQQPAQPQQEPVYAFRRKGQDSFVTCDKERYEELAGKPNLFQVTTFYVAPPQRQPLTDEQMREALRQCPHDTVENLRVRWLYAKDFARAIEAAHGIKGDA